MKLWPFRPREEKSLTPAEGSGWYTIFESYAGAWQRNVTVNQDGVLAQSVRVPVPSDDRAGYFQAAHHADAS